ncbi:MAG TPA: ATP-binding protein [Treponemataceae bacterium]|nr:ATP-binding protein [Treponemataceae bacterium]
MYIKRAIEETLQSISATFPVLLLTGPRQVGKSTVLEHLAGNTRLIVSLDDPDIRFLAKTDPSLFMQRYHPPILIDEIQYAPELLPYIKITVDRSKRNGDFWLTGSQSFLIMKGVSESLAGRVGIAQMVGLSFREIDALPSCPFNPEPQELMDRLKVSRKIDVRELYERIFRGSMPRLYADPSIDPGIFYRSYIESYLKRDIKDLAQVADELAFYKFMTVTAARTARPLVYEEIAQECGVSSPTVKKWLSILQSSNIIALVQPYSNNMLKRITKMPLIHFLDTGLCAHLLRWGNPETLERGAMAGAFFESWVFSELYKSFLNAGREPPLYYYRDKDKKEIDILILQNGKVYPVEVKKSGSPGKDAIKHFSVLEPLSDVEVGTGSVVCMMNDLLPVNEKNWYVPVWLI